MQETTLTSAYLIHTKDFRESSLIIDFFTREHGFIKAIAKGVRGDKKNNKRGLLQPFIPLLINWRGRSELVTLNNVELQGPPIFFKRQDLAVAFYINELLYYILNKFTGLPMPELWQNYHHLIKYLNSADKTEHNLEIKLREFELNLLDDIGYGLQYDSISTDGYYAYNYEDGFFSINNHTSNKILSIKGDVILGIKNREWDKPEVLALTKKLLRIIIKNHIGNREFNSRKLYSLDNV